MLRVRANRSLCVLLSMLVAMSGCGGNVHDHQVASNTKSATSYAIPADELQADRSYITPIQLQTEVNPATTLEAAAAATATAPAESPAATVKAPAVTAPAATPPAQDFYIRTESVPPTFRNLGTGPGMGGDKYAYVQENNFIAVNAQPLSTFSIDVDTASYSKTRMYLMQQHALPPVDAVRIEEFVNYFDYSYAPPTGHDPFAVHVEVAQCPWKQTHLLARVGLKGRDVEQQRPACNLVFLLDVSGSMNAPNRLPLVQQSMRLLTSQLKEGDRVSIVVYAGAAGLVLPTTYGDRRGEILDAINRLQAGGSTNGGAGIQLAYRMAKDNLITGGVNRVILCTDGDFNVGITSPADLVRMAEAEAKSGVFLTVLGFGMGNHNDAMLEEISAKANGAYAFIDNEIEARKVFVEQINSTLVTIAKDVKIQIEFNPAAVSSYRLIGYENRMLAAHDFNNDRKDAGEIGAGHTVTALYELIPHGGIESANTGRVDELKYQTKTNLAQGAVNAELMTVKLRYKQPDSDTSRLISRAVPLSDRSFGEATNDFRFAASVASFGMLLRHSAHAGDTNPDAVLEIAQAALGNDPNGHRREFIELVKTAKSISTGEPIASSSTPTFVLPQQPQIIYRPAGIEYRYHTDTTLIYAMACVLVYLVFSALLGFVIVVVTYRVTTRTALAPTLQCVPALKSK